MNALSNEPVVRTLDRLHQEARGDWKHFVGIAPRALWSRLTGKSFMKSIRPTDLSGAYIPVNREAGRFLYLMARSIDARRIVEFGTSFGISTIYLAAAARDAGGMVYSTEIEPTKCRKAEANLRDAGLAEHAKILEGDATKTLASVSGAIDLLFLDGWKDLYVPILEQLLPQLRRGALVIADNTDFADCRPYLDRIRAKDSGFVTMPMFGGTMEIAYNAGV